MAILQTGIDKGTLSKRPYIRRARPADKQAVLRFCQNTWEWGDYISQVWDRWLNEPGGKVLVVTVDSLLVAIGHIIMLTSGEAWLEGLRVDPAYRRMGIATRLIQRLLAEARTLRANTVRFITSSVNTPVHHLATKLRFTRVAVISPYKAGAEQVKTPLSKPEQWDLPCVLSFMQKSTMPAAMGGLYSTGWRFHSLSTEQLKFRMNKGQVRIIKNGENVSALAILEPGYSGEGLLVVYIDGQPHALSTLALGLRAEAVKYEPQQVVVRLPDNSEVQNIFHSAGFQLQTEQPFWIYQRDQHPKYRLL